MKKSFFFDLTLLAFDTVKYLYQYFEAETSEPEKAFEAADIQSFQCFFDIVENQKVHFLAYLAALLAHGLVRVKYQDGERETCDPNSMFYLQLDQAAVFGWDETWYANLKEKEELSLVEIIKKYNLVEIGFIFNAYDFWIDKEEKKVRTYLLLLSYFKPQVLESYLK